MGALTIVADRQMQVSGVKGERWWVASGNQSGALWCVDLRVFRPLKPILGTVDLAIGWHAGGRQVSNGTKAGVMVADVGRDEGIYPQFIALLEEPIKCLEHG